MLRIVALLVLCASATGCADMLRDRRDAPWDPKGSAQIMDQMPNWEGGAAKICCGHLRSCGAGQTPKC